MADNVTIPRAYLDTLLRREGSCDPGHFIKISNTHYRSLVQDANHLYSLKAALIAGGVSEETLRLLVDSQQCPARENGFQDESFHHPTLLSKETVTEKSTTERLPVKNSRSNGLVRPHLAGPFMPHTPTTLEYSDNEQDTYSTHRQVYYETSHADRSLVLEGVPKSASLSDLVEIIRGGMISNIYIRRRDQSAHVSFVQPEAAAQFFRHLQQHQIFVKNQNLEAFWDDQQAYLPGWIINRILNNGATRNLVVRRPRSDITIETIQADLEHIHRLEVINIKFAGDSFWIQLNSIHIAITAKDCMQSRVKYRNSKIEFFPDECDKPLVLTTTRSKKQTLSPPKTNPATVVLPLKNRFETLSIEYDTSEESV